MDNKQFHDSYHRKYINWIIFTFLFVAAVWGVSDALLAIFGIPSKVVILGSEYIEGMGFALRRGFQTQFCYVNSDGFRGEELPPRDPEEIRILVLGDSVTFGTGLEQGEEWPAQLEKFLRQHGIPATIMNGGTPGYWPGSMFNMLKHYDKRMKIDLVLLQATGNMIINVTNQQNSIPDNFRQAAKYIFPNESNLIPRRECQNIGDPLFQNVQNTNIPVILKYLSSHSPAVQSLISLWSKPWHTPTLTPTPKPWWQANPCRLDPLSLAAMSLADMMAYSEERKLPIVALKPSYVFNLRQVRDTPSLLTHFLPKEIKDNPDQLLKIVDTIGEMFNFLEGRNAVKGHSYVKFLDTTTAFESKYQLLRREPGKEYDIKKLYMDYGHFLKNGSTMFAQIVGQDLIDKKIVIPVTAGEWVHPSYRPVTLSDLKPAKIDVSSPFSAIKPIIIGCILLSLLIIPAGVVVQSFIGAHGGNGLTVPIKGFFALYAIALFTRNFLFDEYYVLLIFAVAIWGAFAVQLWRSPNGWTSLFNRAALLAFRTVVLAGAFSGFIILCISHPKDHPHLKFTKGEFENEMQALATWSDYQSIPAAIRPTTRSLWVRLLNDRAPRPYLLVQALVTYRDILKPASPSVSAFLSRIGGGEASGRWTLISEWAMFSSALVMGVMGAVPLAIRRRAAMAVVLGIPTATLAAIYMPTPLGCQILAAIMALLFATSIKRQWVKYCLYFVAGGMLYILPAQQFLAITVLAAILAAVTFFLDSRNRLGSCSIGSAVATGVFALVSQVGGRGFIFNMTVTNLQLYEMLDTVKAPHFFY